MSVREYEVTAAAPALFVGNCHADWDTQSSICTGSIGGVAVRIVVTGGNPMPLPMHWPQFLRALADGMER